MNLKPGTRLRSSVCTTEVVVVKASAADVDLRCGGVAMAPLDQAATGDGLQAGFDGGTQVGKRYTNEAGDIELLCSKAGAGSLSLGDTLLELKTAKPLPSSD